MLIPTTEEISANIKKFSLPIYVKNHYPDFYKALMDLPCPDGCKFTERLWTYYHPEQRPICPVCGSLTRFSCWSKGYNEFCSALCAKIGSRERANRTMIERYGGVGLASEETREKIQKTCEGRYGSIWAMSSPEVSKKSQDTLIERYGGVGLASEEIKMSHESTMLERYGTVHALCNEDIRGRVIKNHKNIKKHKKKLNTPQKDIIKDNSNSKNVNIYPQQILNTSIESFVRSILDDYKIHYECNNRSILGGQELDIYIPSKHLAIECNGVFWHSDMQKPKRYHINKRKQCLNNGIQLISIWEDQIIHKPDIVRSVVLAKLGIYDRSIYARCCDVREVGSKESREFLDKNHLQGAINGSIRLGLYYNDELVSLMAFGKSRKCLNEAGSWELYRYCTALNTTIVGGAMRLFKSFIRAQHPSEVVSFASNDISDGGLYSRLGFKKCGKESVSYWYIDKKMCRHHRYKFRRSELTKMGYDKSQSEPSITSSMGLMKIYDSGQSKWIWVGE